MAVAQVTGFRYLFSEGYSSAKGNLREYLRVSIIARSVHY